MKQLTVTRRTMGEPRRRTWLPAALFALVAVLAFGTLTGVAVAAEQSVNVSGGGTSVEVGKDVIVPAGKTAEVLVAVGGDVSVDGTAGSVVAVGGDVAVNGTVEERVIAIGGDVTLASGGVIGTSLKPDDASMVTIGGDFANQGGTITGRQVTETNWRTTVDWEQWTRWSRPLAIGWFGIGRFISWLGGTVVFIILALIAAAVLPRQIKDVNAQIVSRTAASLGWGALGTFIVIPIVSVVLVITLIGIPVAILGWLALIFLYLFAVVCFAVLIGDRVLAALGQHTENTLGNAAVGAVLLALVGLVPVLGPLALFVLSVIGVGACYLAYAEYRRSRKLAAAAAPAGQVQIGPTPAAAAPGYAQPPATWEAQPPATPSMTESYAAPAGPETTTQTAQAPPAPPVEAGEAPSAPATDTAEPQPPAAPDAPESPTQPT